MTAVERTHSFTVDRTGEVLAALPGLLHGWLLGTRTARHDVTKRS